MKPERPILLCPGPVRTSDSVRRALAESDYCHRDVAFKELAARVSCGLARLLDAPDHDVLLLGGGGTSATEASLATFVAPDEEILVVSNGAFAERIGEMAGVLGAHLHLLTYPWGEPVRLDDLVRELDGHPDVRAVAMVHHETSVGALNPIEEAGKLLHRRGIRYFVDAVSSVGAEVLSVSRSHIGALIGSANKCLHGVAGVSFVVVDRSWWETLPSAPPRSLFLDLRRYRAALDDGETSPFTPPVAAIVALDRALKELRDTGGPEARREHYTQLNEAVRTGLLELGMAPSNGVPRSCAMTLAQLPHGVDFEQFQHSLRQKGFLIYPAKGALRPTHFIVANMGDLDMGSIEAFLAAARQVAATVGAGGPAH